MISILPSAAPQFLVETVHEKDEERGIVPCSWLAFLAAIRDGRLLAELPPADLKTVLFLLTFLASNGHFMAKGPPVASATGCSVRKAMERLARLASFRRQGQPVAAHVRHQSGLERYSPTPAIVGVAFEAPPRPPANEPIIAAGRDAVVRSRGKSLPTQERTTNLISRFVMAGGSEFRSR